ncbi:uncharacterized protein LOC126851966 isoform X2 [Cataglyphis hispanica]|uniref:uncharacterized protein LOC126851966 isoform X2 n=1 Tax=Cataglyphis hispanica TaxID=1086592 RepID=UPI00218017C1|nr:uncharacterized protein LOC126851966 isoform X2 [Cataglyphis hispanica]
MEVETQIIRVYHMLIIFALITGTSSIIAYDCGGAYLNLTTVSLLRSGECDIHMETPVATNTYIQLLQLSTYTHTEIIQCKIEITRTISHCGMHSHISAVHKGQASYLQETSRLRCVEMHKLGILKIGVSEIMDNLKSNHTYYRSFTLAGKVNTDGTCKGISYSDYYGSWDDVIVQASAKITMKSSYVPVSLETGKIILKSGTICNLADEHCVDSEDGYTFWSSIPNTACNFNNYDVLYEGTATKIQGLLNSQNTTVVTLESQETTFSLTLTRPHTICGYTLYSTEHPKLFIFETQKGNTFKTKTETAVNNLDLFTYVNSKFVYVERYIRNQITTLYKDIIMQKCELEKQVIQNTLSLAAILPDEFAYRIMKSPGYMAVTSGEGIHIVKCIPIEVILRKTNSCYSELPITFRNTSLFMTPKSHIVIKHGTLRDCNPLLPIIYNIENTWLQFNPAPSLVHTPIEIKPMTKLSWSYLAPKALATSGIYTQKDLDNLRDHIMFPAEKIAVLHTIARGFTGQTFQSDTVSLQDLLDENSLNKIYSNTLTKIWDGFTTFGAATAGVFGIFIIIRIIKIVFDTLIHGYALHAAYGCSLHLLGAIWSSFTHLLLYLANRPQTDTNTPTTPKETCDQNTETSAPPNEPQEIPIVYTFRDLRARLDE